MNHKHKAAIIAFLPLAVASLAWTAQTTPQSPSAPKQIPAASEAAKTPQKQPAAFVSGKDPDYTDSAREHHIEGTVILSVKVNEKGKVTAVKVINSLEKSLDRRAMNAVKHWKFAPATMDGRPVASQFNVSVDFRLNN
jgi:protein TonB